MSYHDRILRVMLYVQAHLDDELSLDHLAGVACFSPFHFHRVFRGMTGEPVAEYVRRLRLERAATRLKTGAAPVVDLAFEAGYESHEAFTRAFRARFGEAPSTYRESHALPSDPLPGLRFVHLPERRIAFLRHTGPYSEVGRAWSRLFQLAGPLGLLGPGLDFLGICHDDPDVTAPANVRYDAALSVRPDFQPTGDLLAATLPARDYATLRHIGPYDTLSDSYARLCGGLLPSTGREPASAPALEFYRNSPANAAPDALVTDLYVPLE